MKIINSTQDMAAQRVAEQEQTPNSTLPGKHQKTPKTPEIQ